MGWAVNEMANEPVISEECAKDLVQTCPDLWSDASDVVQGGKLYFDPDHDEHIDFLGNKEGVIEVLCRHKVRGDICFGSEDGDNAGSYWGYRFDGKGGMTPLIGQVVFKEVPQPLKGKTVAVTGKFSGASREEVKQWIEAAGGKFAEFITARTDILVKGTKPGRKLGLARQRHVTVLDERDFRKLLQGS